MDDDINSGVSQRGRHYVIADEIKSGLTYSSRKKKKEEAKERSF